MKGNDNENKAELLERIQDSLDKASRRTYKAKKNLFALARLDQDNSAKRYDKLNSDLTIAYQVLLATSRALHPDADKSEPQSKNEAAAEMKANLMDAGNWIFQTSLSLERARKALESMEQTANEDEKKELKLKEGLLDGIIQRLNEMAVEIGRRLGAKIEMPSENK